MASSWSLTLTPALTEKLIKADERKLKHILFNLLSNAVKFTSEGGAVRIRAENDREFFRIAVADTGIGIRREELDRIWGEMALAEEKKARLVSLEAQAVLEKGRLDREEFIATVRRNTG